MFKDPGEEIAKQMVSKASGVTGFNREKGVYIMEMWVKKSKGSASRRQHTEQNEDDRAGRVRMGSSAGDGEDMELDVVAADDYEEFVSRCRRKGAKARGFQGLGR